MELAHLRVHPGGAGQRGLRLPSDAQLPRGAHGVPLVRRHDADEIATAQGARVRNVADRTLIDADHARAIAVGALAARSHDAAMPHAGPADVLHVRVRAGCLRRYVFARHIGAHDLVVARRFDRGLAGERQIERPIAEQVAVRDRTSRRAAHAHDTVGDRELRDGRAEPRRGEREQRLARLGRGCANSWTAERHGRARYGTALIRRPVAREAREIHLLHREIELLGRDLQQRRRGALAELGMTVKHRSRVVAVDSKPRVEQFLFRLAGPERQRHADGLLCAGTQRQRKPDEQRATGFQ